MSEQAAQVRTWLDLPERGSLAGIRALIWIVLRIGRAPGRAVLRLVVLWHTLFAGAQRRASADYRARVGLPDGFWAAYRHFLHFAFAALDRAFFLGGRTDGFEITRTGHAYIANLRDTRRGAILLGAHVGSFEAMRGKGHDARLRIHPVVNFRNSKRINEVLGVLDRDAPKLISLADDGTGAVLKMREVVDGGGLLALLADRVGPDDRHVVVPFLGAPARFPTGPFLVASALRCPVYLVFGLYEGGAKYDLHCEPFAERVELPRGRRDEALREHVTRYAQALERYVRKSPWCWFNFHPFWEAA
jgi:predicted LPLAT superfamily acyltransferase